ncbi:hypothetical protein [Streptomyces sp. CA-111067]|uniref:hypothetical protein n=1 Tax=Streptomyces sp. CA-111067 TaxID=3240046 RepID=UPI003D99BE53
MPYPPSGEDTPNHPRPGADGAGAYEYEGQAPAGGRSDGYGYPPGQQEGYGYPPGPQPQSDGYGYAAGPEGDGYAPGPQGGAYVPEPLTGNGWTGDYAAPAGAQSWDPTPAAADPQQYAADSTYPYGTDNGYGTDGGYGAGTTYGTDSAYPGGNGNGNGYGTADPNAYGAPAQQPQDPYSVPAPADPYSAGSAPSGYGAGTPHSGYGAADTHSTGDPNVYGAVQHPYARAGYQESPAQAVGQTAVLPVIEDGPGPDGAEAPPVRSGSPIIAPGIQPAALTDVLGGLLAAGAAIGKPGLAVVLVVLQAVTAAGWFRLNGMWPARQGIALAFLGGVVADAAVLAVTGAHGPAALVGTLGVWLLLVLVLQLRHHGSPDERLSSLTATSASTLLTVLAAGYLATATAHTGTDPVVVAAIAVAVATLVRALPLPGAAVSIAGSLLLAAASGYATGHAAGYPTGHAVLLAAAAGACALIGLRVASYDFPSRFVHFTAGVALPLTAAAPVVYVLSRALA